ncbi:hypothetical protein WR25_00398 [Diploscapter pachys]|uniref:G-protein coupled receptors family 1 profile domain-containing protein n=1 Tax=Diploscapter pachys TaxID=2018661 RepID=A0A2A2KPW6_9BILA|nr:hypothetical protein WR25_00398 [Diploscapter pachys]
MNQSYSSACGTAIPRYPKYILTEHVLSVLTTCVNITATYCLLYRSPSFMGKFRYVLLYHLLASTICDLFLSLGTIPVIMIPFMVGYSIGVLQFVDPYYLAVMGFGLVGLVVSTIVLLFAYRHYQLLPSFHKHQLSKRNKRIGFVLLHAFIFLFSVPAIVTGLFDQNQMKNELASQIRSSGGCVPAELFQPYAYIGMVSPLPVLIIAAVTTIVCLGVCGYFVLSALFYLHTQIRHIEACFTSDDDHSIRLALVQIAFVYAQLAIE